MSIVIIALPNIQQDLQLTTTELQWVPGIYVLAYTGFQLLGGRAADLLGRRLIFLLGAMLFGMASFIAGLAPSGWLLILARGGQGDRRGLDLSCGSLHSHDNLCRRAGAQQGSGVFSAMGAAGFTGGVILGGVVTTFLSWHWVFFLNIPFVLLIPLLSRLAAPEGSAAYPREKI